jgi:uracil DNA glycosylase
MLWGNHAKLLKKFILQSEDTLILEWTHPSPLSGKSFVGNNHFELCNKHLVKLGLKSI